MGVLVTPLTVEETSEIDRESLSVARSLELGTALHVIEGETAVRPGQTLFPVRHWCESPP